MDTADKKLRIKLAFMVADGRPGAKLWMINRIISLNYSDYAERFLEDFKRTKNARDACTKGLDKLLKMERKLKCSCNKKARRKHADLFVDTMQKMVRADDKVDHYIHLKSDLIKQWKLIKYL